MLYEKIFVVLGRGIVFEIIVIKFGDRIGVYWGFVREGERD